MPALILVSPESLTGKTTVAMGLARRIASEGKALTLSRLPGDEHSEADLALFAALTVGSPEATKADINLIEAPAGDPAAFLESSPDARAVVVATASTSAPELAEYCRHVRDRLAGVIINKTPAKRLEAIRAEAEAAGLHLIAIVPEDRLLAAPVLRDVVRTLSAQAEHLDNGRSLQPLDRPVIATISADPGQGYFAGYGASAVIVRSDKPDLQLAALNAGANCLIVTGGLPILSYVLDRAEEDQIPLLRTGLDTISAVQRIEGTYGSLPFAGGEAKIGRISALLADVDVASLTG